MNILRAAEDEFRLTLSPVEVRIFINCMSETIRQIGGREYAARMSANVEQIRAIIAELEAALA